MDDRSRQLLKILVQRYIVEGQPVGSRSLAKFSQLDVSASTIRNVMSDLENMGLVTSPHTSAGRVPTTKGFRLFVDNLLTLNTINATEAAIIEKTFESDVPGEVISHAADLLSNLSKFAGVVTTSKKALIFRQVEFLQLNKKRLLLILVTPDGEVLNKILKVDETYSPELLNEAGNYLTSNFSGLSFLKVQEKLALELEKLRKDLSGLMLKAVEEGGAVLSDSEGSVLISGQKHLFNVSEISDNVDRMKSVYHLLEQKSNIAKLLDSLPSAKGVTIFIGGESSLMPEEQLSLVVSPFTVKGRVVGTLGVIGPTRMAYERVIPIVDITARVVSTALSQSELFDRERKVL
jgi:heat-inducible transcriptional repressor